MSNQSDVLIRITKWLYLLQVLIKPLKRYALCLEMGHWPTPFGLAHVDVFWCALDERLTF